MQTGTRCSLGSTTRLGIRSAEKLSRTLSGYKRSADVYLVSRPLSLGRTGWHWPVSDVTHTKEGTGCKQDQRRLLCPLDSKIKLGARLHRLGAEDSEGRLAPCSVCNPDGMGCPKQRSCGSPSMSARERLLEIVYTTWRSFQISSWTD